MTADDFVQTESAALIRSERWNRSSVDCITDLKREWEIH